MLVKVAHRDKARLAEKLKQIGLHPDRRSAQRLAKLIIEEYEGKYPEAMRCLDEGLEDSLLRTKFDTNLKFCLKFIKKCLLIIL